MSATLVADVVEAAARVREAHTTHGLSHAVSGFIRAIGSVPDERANSMTSDEARLLQSLGEDVIELIEEHVADAPNSRQAQSLVSAVYEIRRLLEEARHWRHHYAIARQS